MDRDNNLFDIPQMGIYSNPHGIVEEHAYLPQFTSPFLSPGNEFPYLVPQMMNTFGGYPLQQYPPYFYRQMYQDPSNTTQLNSEQNLFPPYGMINPLSLYPLQGTNFFPSSIMLLQNNSFNQKLSKENKSFLQGVQEVTVNDNLVNSHLSPSPLLLSSRDAIMPTPDSDLSPNLFKCKTNVLSSPPSQHHRRGSSKSPSHRTSKSFQDQVKEELKKEMKNTDLNEISSMNCEFVCKSTTQNLCHDNNNHYSDNNNGSLFSQTNIIKMSQNTVFSLLSHGRTMGVETDGGEMMHKDEMMNHDWGDRYNFIAGEPKDESLNLKVFSNNDFLQSSKTIIQKSENEPNMHSSKNLKFSLEGMDSLTDVSHTPISSNTNNYFTRMTFPSLLMTTNSFSSDDLTEAFKLNQPVDLAVPSAQNIAAAICNSESNSYGTYLEPNKYLSVNSKNIKKLSVKSPVGVHRNKSNRKKIREFVSISCPASSTSSPANRIPIGVAKALRRSKNDVINYSTLVTATNGSESLIPKDFLFDARTNFTNSHVSESQYKEFDFNVKSPLDLCMNSQSKLSNSHDSCLHCGRPFKVDIISRGTSPIIFADALPPIPQIKQSLDEKDLALDNKLSILTTDVLMENEHGSQFRHKNVALIDGDLKATYFRNMLEDPSCLKTNLFLNLANKTHSNNFDHNLKVSKCVEQDGNGDANLLSCISLDLHQNAGLLMGINKNNNEVLLKPTISHSVDVINSESKEEDERSGAVAAATEKEQEQETTNIFDGSSVSSRIDLDDGDGLKMLSSIALERTNPSGQVGMRRCSLLDFPISQLMGIDTDEFEGSGNKHLNSTGSQLSSIAASTSSDDDVFEKAVTNEGELRNEIDRIKYEYKCEYRNHIKLNKRKEYRCRSLMGAGSDGSNDISKHRSVGSASKHIESKNSFNKSLGKKSRKLSKVSEKVKSANNIKNKKTGKLASNTETSVQYKLLKNNHLEISDLVDGLQILYKRDNLYVEARLQAISPPDIYGILVENERTRKPVIVCQEEVLTNAVMIVKPKNKLELQEGMRVCAHWSRKFSCLYPGIVHDSSDDEDAADDDKGVTIAFDDGDTGRIPIECVRVLPLHDAIKKGEIKLSEKSEMEANLSYATYQKKKNEDVEFKKNDTKHIRRVTCKILEKRAKQWVCYGSVTKRVMVKGKCKRIYYESIKNGRQIIKVGDSVAFISKKKKVPTATLR